MNYKKHTLPNGIRVILAPMRDTETTTVLVMTGAGSRYEARRENGVAHFLEHMFFKGTKNRPTAFDISRELDAIGAEYNAFTGKEYTGYYAKTDAKHWLTALDVVSDIFLNATIAKEEIERERGPIIQEISMYEDTPTRRVSEIFEQELYGDTPLGWDIAGPKENIRRLKRADFLRFLKRAYAGENVVVGVAGKIDEKKVMTEIRRRFHALSRHKKPTYKKIREKQTAPFVRIQKKKTDQTHFVLGARTFGRGHKDRFTLSVLSTILGGGMSSRLFMQVRERRGLAYGVHTSAEAYHDAGYIATQCGVEHKNLKETIRVIVSEYKKIASEEVKEDELIKAKEYIKGKMAMGLEGSDAVVEYLVSQEILKGKVTLPAEYAEKIDRVSALDIRRLSQNIFRADNLTLAVIGPRDGKGEMEKLLNSY